MPPGSFEATPAPERAIAEALLDQEEQQSLDSFGGWLGWLEADPAGAILALRARAILGRPLPEELEELSDALGEFPAPDSLGTAS